MLPLGQLIEGAINDLSTMTMSHRSRGAEMMKAIAAAVQSLAIAEAQRQCDGRWRNIEYDAELL